MGDRLTLEQRRVVASLMEMYGSPTVVRQKFAEQFTEVEVKLRPTVSRPDRLGVSHPFFFSLKFSLNSCGFVIL
jgi:hypothetical protein